MAIDIHPSQVKPEEKPRIATIVKEDGETYEGGLPPITEIEIPSTTTKSALIRWLHAVGYLPKEIYVFLGIKYQMVRNIITNTPKRAAREDLPPLVIKYKVTNLPPEEEMIQDALDGALDASLMAGRKVRNRERLDSLRVNPDQTELEED